jgi:hypothetical protein
VLALLSLLLLSACATLPRTPVPLDEIYAAAVPDMPGIRAWGGQPSPEFQRDLVESVRQERAAEDARPDGGVDKYAALALSGGGSDGAFGAGFLNGWSAARTRPDFKLVTGISTGALTAPFAFLGSDYDAELKQVYTTITTENILDINSIFGILFQSEAFAKSTPLQNLVAEHVDMELLQAHDEHGRAAAVRLEHGPDCELRHAAGTGSFPSDHGRFRVDSGGVSPGHDRGRTE